MPQTLLTIVLLEFGYEVYPFGYENYLTNIVRHMQRDSGNASVEKIRSAPDLFVFDRESNTGFLVEVKSTTQRDERRYSITQSDIDKYFRYWNEAILVVYSARSKNFYAQEMSRLDLSKKKPVANTSSGTLNYPFDLTTEFESLPDKFCRIDPRWFEYVWSRLRDAFSKLACDERTGS